jgi:dihydroxyacetone kinase-like predicted kinase
MNPSTKELLHAVEKSSAHNVIILPNNKKYYFSGRTGQKLTKKNIKVVPTKPCRRSSRPAGFDYDAGYDSNHRLMTEAIGNVKTIEVTQAVRSTKVNGLDIRDNQYICLLDGQIVSVSNQYQEGLFDTFNKIDMSQFEVITVYFGAVIEPDQAQNLSAMIIEKYPHLQIEVIDGEATALPLHTIVE